MSYKAVYKCRLCGVTYQPGTTTGKEIAEMCMVEMIVGLKGTKPQAPTMTEMHHCGGNHAGSIGLADFQGWEAHEND